MVIWNKFAGFQAKQIKRRENEKNIGAGDSRD